jgi:hypothetical protein
MPISALELEVALRAAGLSSFYRKTLSLLSEVGISDEISIADVARALRESGVAAPLIAVGVAKVLLFETVCEHAGLMFVYYLCFTLCFIQRSCHVRVKV